MTAKELSHVLTEEEPAETAKAKAWNKCDRQTRAILLLSIEPEIAKLVLSCKTAKEVWDGLAQVHEEKSSVNKVQLQKEFYDSKMSPGTKVSTYVTHIKYLARQLEDSGEKVSEDSLTAKIVSGLTDDYRHLVSSWMGTPDNERTYERLLARLLAEERMVAGSSEKEDATALNMRNMVKKGQKGKDKNTKLECWCCKKVGHLRRDCKYYNKKDDDNKSDKNSKNEKNQKTSKKEENKTGIDSKCTQRRLQLVVFRLWSKQSYDHAP